MVNERKSVLDEASLEEFLDRKSDILIMYVGESS